MARHAAHGPSLPVNYRWCNAATASDVTHAESAVMPDALEGARWLNQAAR